MFAVPATQQKLPQQQNKDSCLATLSAQHPPSVQHLRQDFLPAQAAGCGRKSLNAVDDCGTGIPLSPTGPGQQDLPSC